VSIQEIVGMEGPVVTMQEIFRFRRTGTGKNGEVEGVYESTGVVPHVSERIELLGENLTGLFERNGARR
jgi:pilus assembly protein CpaF